MVSCGFDQGDSRGIGEKCLDSGYILKGKQIKFFGGLATRHERNNIENLGIYSWRGEVTIN